MQVSHRWLFVPLVLFLAASAQAQSTASGGKEIFVSPRGDDRQAGTAEAPLRTLQRAADLLGPGDICTVRGGTYRESVRPLRSGTAEQPIVYRAYPGEPVYLSGSDPVTDWKEARESVYAASYRGQGEQLFLDEQMMQVARWPNAPLDPMKGTWANAESGSEAGCIKVSSLPQFSLSGAWIKMLPGHEWCAWTRPLEAGPPGSLCFAPDGSLKRDFLGIGPGTPYYVAGVSGLLDAPGEWCWEPQKQRLLLMTPGRDSPRQHRVEVKARELGFALQKLSFVRLEGFRFFACTVDMTDCNNCLLRDCHLRYPSHFEQCEGWSPAHNKPTGLIVSGTGNQVLGCSVEWSAGNGITLAGQGNRISNCLVRLTDYAAVNCAAVFMSGEHNTVEHCSLSDSGRFVVHHAGLKAGRIEYNDMSRAGRLTSDCGITYCWNEDGAKTEIAFNWVHDNSSLVGSGIYLDNGSSNFRVHHNVCWGNAAGINLNTPSRNNLVAYNSVFDNGKAVAYWSPTRSVDFSGTRLLNNIFVGEVNYGQGATLSGNFQGNDPRLLSPAGWTPVSKETAEILQLARKDLLIEHPTGKTLRPPRGSWDFRPAPDSACRGAAEPVPDLEPSGVDVGAYESEVEAWIPGHNWGEPPSFQGIFADKSTPYPPEP